MSLTKRFILWAKRRTARSHWFRVVTFDDQFEFRRFCFLWMDEYVTKRGTHFRRPPWWRPFNIFIHWWRPLPGSQEDMHDHPRWTITICLRGQMWEHTPWGTKLLLPGCIVFRSRKFIHSFSVPEAYRGKTWTMFIVGRRNHPQNSYVVKREGR